MPDLNIKQLVTAKERIWQLIAIISVITLILFLATRTKVVIDYKWVFGIAIIMLVYVYLQVYSKKKAINLKEVIRQIRDDWLILTDIYLDTTKYQFRPLSQGEYLFHFYNDGIVIRFQIGIGIQGAYIDTITSVANEIEKSKLASKLVEQGGIKQLTREQLEKLGIDLNV